MTQRIKFYQTGTFTLGNRLLDADQRTVQATIERQVCGYGQLGNNDPSFSATIV